MLPNFEKILWIIKAKIGAQKGEETFQQKRRTLPIWQSLRRASQAAYLRGNAICVTGY
jgi:hypothetical protein